MESPYIDIDDAFLEVFAKQTGGKRLLTKHHYYRRQAARKKTFTRDPDHNTQFEVIEAIDKAEAEELPLNQEMSGYPNMGRYREEGYDLITF